MCEGSWVVPADRVDRVGPQERERKCDRSAELVEFVIDLRERARRVEVVEEGDELELKLATTPADHHLDELVGRGRRLVVGVRGLVLAEVVLDRLHNRRTVLFQDFLGVLGEGQDFFSILTNEPQSTAIQNGVGIVELILANLALRLEPFLEMALEAVLEEDLPSTPRRSAGQTLSLARPARVARAQVSTDTHIV